VRDPGGGAAVRSATMGMHVGQSGSIKNDINVTPLIDVVLVLLIIFLVTLPLMMRTIGLQVPRKIDIGQVSEQKSIVVTVRSDLSAEIDTGERKLVAPVSDVAARLRAELDGRTDKLVFVDFEDPVPWDQAILAMDTIRSVARDRDHNDVIVALKIRDRSTPPDRP
jgi:biopolymer transport protein ExbD